MAIRLFFEYDNLVVQMPVNPPELEVAADGNNERIEIISLGEVSILKQKKLEKIKIECFFPDEISSNAPYVLTKGQFQPPTFYINFFERIRNDKKPVRFVVTDTDINKLYSIDSFSHKRNGGTDDIEYSLELTEYRPHAPKVVTIQLPAVVNNTQTPTATTSDVRASGNFSNSFAIGHVVTCSGSYWFSSYGAKPSKQFPSGFKGKISHIVSSKDRKYRFHIQTLNGGNMGWVKNEQMKH